MAWSQVNSVGFSVKYLANVVWMSFAILLFSTGGLSSSLTVSYTASHRAVVFVPSSLGVYFMEAFMDLYVGSPCKTVYLIVVVASSKESTRSFTSPLTGKAMANTYKHQHSSMFLQSECSFSAFLHFSKSYTSGVWTIWHVAHVYSYVESSPGSS